MPTRGEVARRLTEATRSASRHLLAAPLVYFERYGKRFLPDSPLLSDPAVFRALLDAPAIA